MRKEVDEILARFKREEQELGEEVATFKPCDECSYKIYEEETEYKLISAKGKVKTLCKKCFTKFNKETQDYEYSNFKQTLDKVHKYYASNPF